MGNLIGSSHNKKNVRPGLREMLEDIKKRCTRCGACVKYCAFLNEYGTPGQIAEEYDPSGDKWMRIPYKCSLCGLCRAVCKPGVAPEKLFREMRRQSVDAGYAPFPEHRGPLRYERIGMSRLIVWHGLPKGCTRVLFPGCAFPGSRPQRTKELYNMLRKQDPSLGLILDCCGRISSDLGREEFARKRIETLRAKFVNQGVREIILICPSCFDMFDGLHPDLGVRMIYEVLPAQITAPAAEICRVDLHDPCALRFQANIHDSVRTRLQDAHIETSELNHARLQTVCCGMGAGVKAFAPDMADTWLDMIAADSHGRMLATYCAGCVKRISERVSTVHVLDLLCDTQAALKGQAPETRSLLTYLNRVLIKYYFRKVIR